ncbi:MAG TPA: hypothetical protein VJB35_05740 [Candidatus Nanoarchaeia archaeon]|nr:hypothetical protein [Candidatus Nanoarchaeia archaeon]
MKVIKEKSREYNGKNYYKYKINLPKKILQDSEISEGDELEAKATKDKIIIKKKY